MDFRVIKGGLIVEVGPWNASRGRTTEDEMPVGLEWWWGRFPGEGSGMRMKHRDPYDGAGFILEVTDMGSAGESTTGWVCRRMARRKDELEV